MPTENDSSKNLTKKKSKKAKSSTKVVESKSPSSSLKKSKKTAAPPPEQPIESSKNNRGDVESSGQQQLTINHNVNNRASRGLPLLGGCNMSSLLCIALVVFLLLGGGLWSFFTIPGLYEQIEQLEEQVDRLEGEVDRFAVLNNELNASITELQGINEELNVTATRLESSVKELETENDRLATLNDELETIVGFLDETATEIGDTLEEVTEYLAEQITANRVIVLETLENTFTQEMSNWDCAYRDIFRGRHFIADEDTPIGPNDVEEVMDYVQDRILSELCANRIDFESFIDEQYQMGLLTSNQLFQGVALYSNALMNYYFPDPGLEGLTAEHWAKANYNCVNLPDFVHP